MRNQIVLTVFSSLGVRELWTLFPYSETRHSFFPFYHIEMTLQTYLYFPCQYIANMMLWYCLGELAIQWGRLFFGTLFVLQSVEFVDYFFTYNTAWFQIGGHDFGITYFRMFVMGMVTLYYLSKDRL